MEANAPRAGQAALRRFAANVDEVGVDTHAHLGRARDVVNARDGEQPLVVVERSEEELRGRGAGAHVAIFAGDVVTAGVERRTGDVIINRRRVVEARGAAGAPEVIDLGQELGCVSRNHMAWTLAVSISRYGMYGLVVETSGNQPPRSWPWDCS